MLVAALHTNGAVFGLNEGEVMFANLLNIYLFIFGETQPEVDCTIRGYFTLFQV